MTSEYNIAPLNHAVLFGARYHLPLLAMHAVPESVKGGTMDPTKPETEQMLPAPEQVEGTVPGRVSVPAQ